MRKIISILFLLAIGFTFSGLVFSLEIPEKLDLLLNGNVAEMEIEAVNDFNECENMSVKKTAYYLRDYVEGFHNYTITPDDSERSFEDIVENGGDCYDYTRLYNSMALELGFNTKSMYIRGDKKAHVFLVIWDDELTAYCTIDQLNVDCFKFIGEDEINKTK